MPIAEDSLISPSKLDAKPPLKKSTVAWLAAIVLVMALVGVAAPALFPSGPSGPAPTPANSATPPGEAAQIDTELHKAKVDAAKVAAATSRATAPTPVDGAAAIDRGPLPTGAVAALPAASQSGPLLPSKARRDDNSAALYSQGGVNLSSEGASVEHEAAARQSQSLKYDFGGGEKATAAGSSVLDAVSLGLKSITGGANSSQSDDAETKAARERAAAAIENSNRAAQPTSGTQFDRSWLREVANGASRTPPLKPYQVTNRYTLLQGKVIPAVLTRELNSDLPGIVAACTTIPVYDSIYSAHLLIPPGSCLQGQYSNAISMGQERILFAFTRLMLPDGTSVDLPGNPGADLGGAAGVPGDVDNHFFKMFTTSLLVAWLADKAEQGKTVVQSNGTAGPATAAGQVLVDVSRSILERNRTIPPTITVAKGTRINVEVTRDIEFAGPYGRIIR
jgi:type IV secretion system protein TrbI